MLGDVRVHIERYANMDPERNLRKFLTSRNIGFRNKNNPVPLITQTQNPCIAVWHALKVNQSEH